MTKYIFVTGGVVSGLGKGITAASLGQAFESARAQGRGAEARPLHQRRSRHDEPLSARRGLCHRGRRGDRPRPRPLRTLHRRGPEQISQISPRARCIPERARTRSAAASILASTVQVIPHVTNEIKEFIYQRRQKVRRGRRHHRDRRHDRRYREPAVSSRRSARSALEVGRENCLYHPRDARAVSSRPRTSTSPSRRSTPSRSCRAWASRPDIIVLRCDEPIMDENIFRKIAMFCNVEPDCVIENITIPCLYEAPLMLEKAQLVRRRLPQARSRTAAGGSCRVGGNGRAASTRRTKRVPIALVGKYTQLHDAYLSVAEALRHAGYTVGDATLHIRWVDSETLTEENCWKKCSAACDGILVPGGFGDRGIEGMITRGAVRPRKTDVPYLGHLPRHADRRH